MFAAFCVYAYFKFVRLEEAPPEYEPNESGTVTEIPDGLLPDRPKAVTPADDDDPTLREYNAYLAGLAQSDPDTEHRRQDHPMSTPETPTGAEASRPTAPLVPTGIHPEGAGQLPGAGVGDRSVADRALLRDGAASTASATTR